ncbi:hypothetical protein NDU88_004011 [Pleurodeles waltl]|uniref:Uncharacterized protein n=1 Tax=Pleurodeles waltl TaxID=8319 RepID=A0AAV7QGH3_PLEWA|nr:hypothetical protein NDU88_004011 [Pleurodeles waltl]
MVLKTASTARSCTVSAPAGRVGRTDGVNPCPQRRRATSIRKSAGKTSSVDVRPRGFSGTATIAAAHFFNLARRAQGDEAAAEETAVIQEPSDAMVPTICSIDLATTVSTLGDGRLDLPHTGGAQDGGQLTNSEGIYQ